MNPLRTLLLALPAAFFFTSCYMPVNSVQTFLEDDEVYLKRGERFISDPLPGENLASAPGSTHENEDEYYDRSMSDRERNFNNTFRMNPYLGNSYCSPFGEDWYFGNGWGWGCNPYGAYNSWGYGWGNPYGGYGFNPYSGINYCGYNSWYGNPGFGAWGNPWGNPWGGYWGGYSDPTGSTSSSGAHSSVSVGSTINSAYTEGVIYRNPIKLTDGSKPTTRPWASITDDDYLPAAKNQTSKINSGTSSARNDNFNSKYGSGQSKESTPKPSNSTIATPSGRSEPSRSNPSSPSMNRSPGSSGSSSPSRSTPSPNRKNEPRPSASRSTQKSGSSSSANNDSRYSSESDTPSHSNSYSYSEPKKTDSEYPANRTSYYSSLYNNNEPSQTTKSDRDNGRQESYNPFAGESKKSSASSQPSRPSAGAGDSAKPSTSPPPRPNVRKK